MVLKNILVWEGLEFLGKKFLGLGMTPKNRRENERGVPIHSDIKKSSDIDFFFNSR